jgi:hypothetical protein
MVIVRAIVKVKARIISLQLQLVVVALLPLGMRVLAVEAALLSLPHHLGSA